MLTVFLTANRNVVVLITYLELDFFAYYSKYYALYEKSFIRSFQTKKALKSKERESFLGFFQIAILFSEKFKIEDEQ